ncbi:MAG: hypothetical protein IJV22_04990 [Bacteroidales bacterium]|nr:hypothetical protein [Bacteroidales bacterium]
MLYFLHPTTIDRLQTLLKRPLPTRDASVAGFQWASTFGTHLLHPAAEGTSAEGATTEVSDNELWQICQLWPVPFCSLQRATATVDGTPCEVALSTADCAGLPDPAAWDEALRNLATQPSTMPRTDVHLLVPCVCKSGQLNTNHASDAPIAQSFIQELTRNATTDFTNEYVGRLRREPLGVGHAITRNRLGIECQHACFATVAVHEVTHFAVVDVVVPNCGGDVRRVAEYFRAEHLFMDEVLDVNQTATSAHKHPLGLNAWLWQKGLLPVGDRRILAFSATEVPLQTRIDFLAGECEPMGTIMGSYFEEAASSNVAQYDTAAVYASDVAMLEITHSTTPFFQERIAAQATEVFFIELILLQDASISRINEIISRDSLDMRRAMSYTYDELCTLVNELSKSQRFFDSRNFRYSTVRRSAQFIAERFGLHRQNELLLENKALLEQMIQLHQLKQQNRENNIINIILIVLAVVQVVPLIMDSERNLIVASCLGIITILLLIALRHRINRRQPTVGSPRKRKSNTHN